MLAGDAVGDIQHPSAQGLDGFVTGLAAAAELVHEEAWPSNRNLPARHPLQVATELGFAEGGLGKQRHGSPQLRVDDLGGFGGAVEAAVPDSPHATISQRLSDRGRLRAAELAETKARKVSVDHPLRIFHVGMAHQQHARSRRAHRFERKGERILVQVLSLVRSRFATVAVAAPRSSMPISPKKSPGPSRAAGLPARVTCTWPLSKMKNDSVG